MRHFLAVGLAVLLMGVMAAPAFAEQGNDTTAVNVSFLNNTLQGNFVEAYTWTPGTPITISDETWTFSGTFNGQPASASGKWQGVWNGTGYVGQVTEITKWDMGTMHAIPPTYAEGTPLPRPGLPTAAGAIPGLSTALGRAAGLASPSQANGQAVWLTAGLRKLGQLSFPVAVQGVEAGTLPAPGAGSRVFALTNVAGLDVITGLPRTGEMPGWLNLAALGVLLVGCSALAASRLALARVDRSAL